MEGRVINLTLPYPPLTNNLYLTLMLKGRPTRVSSGKAKKYKTAVKKICERDRIEPFVGDVAMEIMVYRPRRAGDLDGHFKAVIDSLKGFAFNDDKQVSWLFAERFEDKDEPRVEVQIWARNLL
jgi:crossover junction endodeoxyribonuclease RusA